MITYNEPIARLFGQGMVLKDGKAMSKSHGNVVGALDMAQQYGADVGRLYTLFATQPERDLEWSEESIEGSWRFLNKIYSLADRHAMAFRGVKSSIDPPAATHQAKPRLRGTHQALPRGSQDF